MHTFEPSLSDGKRTLEWLFPRSGTVFEIRVLLKGSNRARSGYFNDHAAALKAIEREDTKSGVSGIFVTLNPCDTRLLNRCCNRLQDAASGTLTKNNEIVRRENVLIDGDAIRPAGISATDGERKAAIERIREVGAWLRELGAGDILLGDSGNGGHALLAIDLDVGADTDALCEGVLKAICALWSDDRVKIDTSVATRARLTKIFGTVARKGDDTRDRPHRRSRILHDPSQRRLTGRAVLEKIATMAPVIESPSRSGRPSSFDLDRFITANCIRILREVPWADGRKLELAQCPFVTDHDSRYHPAIFETARGLGFHCFGDRCSGKTWSDLRALFEPSYRGRDERDGEDQQTAAGTENERPRFLPIAEFLARPGADIEYVVDGLLVCGGTSIFAGRPKGGKSTTSLNLSRVVSGGEDFIGRKTRKGRVLYLALEGAEGVWKATLRRMGMGEEDVLICITRAPEGALQWLRDEIERTQPVLIIIDTMQRLLQVADSNDYALGSNVTDAVIELARSVKAHLMMIHHTTKTHHAAIVDEVMGSTAWAAAVDTVIVLRKSERYRTISSEQRVGEPLEETILTIDESLHVHTAGSKEDAESERIGRELVGVVNEAEGPLYRRDLLNAVEGRWETKVRALVQQVKSGRIKRAGDGHKGSPFLFSKPDERNAYSVDGTDDPTSGPVDADSAPEKAPEKDSEFVVPDYTWEPEIQNPKTPEKAQKTAANCGSRRFDFSEPTGT